MNISQLNKAQKWSVFLALIIAITAKSAAADPTLLDPNSVDKTFQQNVQFAARGSIDGTSNGWAIESFPINQPDGTIDQSVVWPLVTPIALPVQGRNLLLSFLLSSNSGIANRHTLGHFQLSYLMDLSPDLNSVFVPMTPSAITSTDPGTTFSVINQEIIVGGANPDDAIYEFQVILSDIPSEITAFRLDVFDDNGTNSADINGLPGGGPGRASNGNFILTNVTVSSYEVIPTPKLPPIFDRRM
jgi:hypothetical protein